MRISFGTFNLNNLFSRYNFQTELATLPETTPEILADLETVIQENQSYTVRTYKGKLVHGKAPEEVAILAERIKRIDVDILAVQEVEDIDALKEFNQMVLDGAYPFVGLIEGNDPRLIDVGILSKYPIGSLASWQFSVHPDEPNNRVFGRDLLEVSILNQKRSEKLFTLYINHLKSNFVDFREDQEVGKKKNNLRRLQQAQAITTIIKQQMRPDSAYAILGDMNDSPESAQLEPLTKDSELTLVNALENPQETRPPKPTDNPPTTTAWTHRFKEANKPPSYELYDQIWLSPALASKHKEAWIDRRINLGGDASDHDPAWVILEL